MIYLPISIKNKIASYESEEKVVCFNSDYTITFSFDGEWGEHAAKTAQFRWFDRENSWQKQEVLFSGDGCPLPVIPDAREVYVGVYAGDIRTSTEAVIPCISSALSKGGAVPEPVPDVYAQVLAKMDKIARFNAADVGNAVENGLRSAKESGEFDGKDGTDGITPRIGENANWWFGEADTGVLASPLVTHRNIASALAFEPAESEEEIHSAELYTVPEGGVRIRFEAHDLVMNIMRYSLSGAYIGTVGSIASGESAQIYPGEQLRFLFRKTGGGVLSEADFPKMLILSELVEVHGFKFAKSKDEFTDVHMKYVLPDGTVWGATGEKGALFTNHANPGLTDEWINGYYIESRHEPMKEKASAVITNIIYVSAKNTVRVSGLIMESDDDGAVYRAKCVKADGTVYYSAAADGTSNGYITVTKREDGVYEVVINAALDHIVFSGIPTGTAEDIIITVEQEIAYTETFRYDKTGYSLVASGLENRILTLEKNAESTALLTTAISDITARVTALEAPVLPSFWEAEVTKTAADVRAVLDAWGRDALAFAMFSDNHGSTRYTGTILRRLVDECSLDYVVNCGDSFTSNYVETEAEAEEMLASFARMMEVIPSEMLLQTVGNHDVSWGKDGSRVYIKNYSPAKRFNRFLKQADSAGRVYGGDGTYFYINHNASKTRFVALNSTWVHYDEDENGEAVYNHTGDHGFGQAQLEWLAGTALKFDEEGWGVVFVSHCPISNRTTAYLRDVKVLRGMLEAFKAKEAFEGVYSDETIPEAHRVNLSVDFTGYTSAELIGWFCGHSHYDVIETMDATPGSTEAEALPLVCVSVTCDHYYYHRDAEGEYLGDGSTADTSGHAVDVVIINRATGEVRLKRCGYYADGTDNEGDREFNYKEAET